jgi:hypothetical protein
MRKNVNDFEVPDFLSTCDFRAITREEQREYDALKNELIEIEIGAEQSLGLLRQELLN